MNVVIKIYIIVCVCLLLFDVVFMLSRGVRNSAFYRENPNLRRRLFNEIAFRTQSGVFTQNFIYDLQKELANPRNLITLVNVIEARPETEAWFRDVIYSQIDVYLKKKRDYEKAYYTYVISILKHDKNALPPQFAGKFLQFLDCKSLYIFSNTMDALYSIGDENLLEIAVGNADKRAGFYHKKLLLDGLLSSTADTQTLCSKLEEHFDTYHPHTQDCLLDFYRMSGYDASPLCQRLMMDKDEDEQVRYSAMRYFFKNPTPQSKEYFMNILKSGDSVTWVEQMLAIQAMENYDEPEIREAIIYKVNSPHWYVRTHAVDYLQEKGLTYDEVYKILSFGDKYADNALLYEYRDNPQMTEYITRVIQFQEEPEKEEIMKAIGAGVSAEQESIHV